MSDMKCPVCDSYLHKIPVKEAWVCGTHDTKDELYGSKELWQELIRTRKALDVAVDALKSAHDYYEYCIQRDKDCDSDDINWDCTAMNMDNDISDALDKITALEQKESAFVHNKIEFPEYNDNLLEEFDKQFFENGQDDDLTETALEQKDK